MENPAAASLAASNTPPAPPASPLRGRAGTVLGILAIACCLALGAFTLRLTDQSKPADWTHDQLTYIPSGKAIKPMVLDYDEAVASLLWVRGMIYFADAYLNQRSTRWLGHIIDVVTTLNPRHLQAYEFAGVVLTKEKRELPKTLPILERGVAEFPKNWRLRLYAAMAHMAHDSNYVKATEILAPIALEEDVPNHIRTLSATFLQKGGGPAMALAFLVERYIRTPNPIQKELFLDRMMRLYEEPVGRPVDVRKRVAKKVLNEAEQNPMVEQMAVGVLGEYLKGMPSANTTKLLRLLGE